MEWRKGVYYGTLAATVAVFVFAVVKLTGYYADAHRSGRQMAEARELIHAEASATSDVARRAKPLSVQSAVAIATQVSDKQDQSSQALPLLPSPPLVQERFKPLLSVNPDVIGWVRIEDTIIDYPVLQSKDNEYYLTRDLDRKPNVNGSIFMDYRNDASSLQGKHAILYGHNMKNKSMFMALLNYESRWYFDNHSTIEFDTLYGDQKWQVFSAYFTTTAEDYIRTDFDSKEQYYDFLIDLQSRSLHKTDVTLSKTDTILTLSTCSNSSDDRRFVVHARLIDG
jgi:sortase B